MDEDDFQSISTDSIDSGLSHQSLEVVLMEELHELRQHRGQQRLCSNYTNTSTKEDQQMLITRL